MIAALAQFMPAASMFAGMRSFEKISRVANTADGVVTGFQEGPEMAFSASEFGNGLVGLVTGNSKDGLLGNLGEIGHSFLAGHLLTVLKNVPGISVLFGVKSLGSAIYNFWQGGATNVLEGCLQLGSAMSTLVPGGKIAVEAITGSTRKYLSNKALFAVLKDDKEVRAKFLSKYKSNLKITVGKPVTKEMTCSARDSAVNDLLKSDSKFKTKFDGLFAVKSREYAEKPLFILDTFNQMTANLRHSAINGYNALKLSRIPSTLALS